MKDWNLIEDLFNELVDLGPTDREQVLAQRCANNLSLKKQVLALLHADAPGQSYLEELSQQLVPMIEQPQQGQVKHYQLLERLGEGGMGVVYKAYDEKLQRLVAIKFLSAWRANNPKDKERFLHEAKAAARLNHPNVCEVYEIDENDEGHLFIVTAFCAGKNFADLIQENRKTISDILDILIQLCDALNAAHQKGIYHRDLKPANIIVSDSGLVRLVDFGIAKISGNDISHTGQVVGTFAYMSPEQFSGASIDHRTDIWALGIVLFEALSGHRPYSNDSPAEIMYQLFNAETPQIKNDDIPLLNNINQVIKRCLSINKQQRFHSTELLANELKALKRRLSEKQQQDFIPSHQSDSSQTKITKTLSEYRKVVAMGLQLNTDLEQDKSPSKDQAVDDLKRLVKKYGGKISNQSQTTCHTYFGYPSLGEGAADNALACALELLNIQVTLATKTDPAFYIRKAVIHNVPVVISDDKVTGTRNISGDIPGNLEELMQIQSPFTLLMSESACTRLRKKIPEHTIWQEQRFQEENLYGLDRKFSEYNFVIEHQHYKTPLLGRIHELGLLQSTWQDVLESESHVVLISGEAGMGKSRLVYELTRSHDLVSSDHQLVECACDPSQQDTSFFPIVQALKRLIAQDKTINDSALKTFLSLHNLESNDNMDIMNWMLGLATEANSNINMVESPESLKRRGLNFLETLLQQFTQQKPLILILEDLHWADATTMEWIDQLLSKQLPPSLFVLLTGRPELFNRWRSYSTLTQLSLSKLARKDARDLLHSVYNQKDIPVDLEQAIINKTGCNPLFVEEYAKMLLSQKSDIVLDNDLGSVPDRLEDILHTRLDHLGGAKTIAQFASVIGRHFSESLLQTLLGDKSDTLSKHLHNLVDADILFSNAQQGYTFKHALIRDALYDSLSEKQKYQIHEEIADHLMTQDAKDELSIAEPIATHLSLAQNWSQSRNWWLRAATSAESNYGLVEAIRLCQKGLSDNGLCTDDDDKVRVELRLQRILGRAQMAAKGYADQGAAAAHIRALHLGRKYSLIKDVYHAMVGLWAHHTVRAQHSAAENLANEMMSLANDMQSADLLVEANMASGATALLTGKLPESRAFFEDALSSYQSTMSKNHIRLYGQDPLVLICSFYAVLEETLGNSQAASDLSARAVKAGGASGHPFSQAFALGFAVNIRFRQKQIDYAKELLNENKALCEKHGIHVFSLFGSIQTAMLMLAAGDTQNGIDSLNTSIVAYKAMGAEVFSPTWSVLLAVSYLQLGKIEQAEIELNKGLQQMNVSGEFLHRPMLEGITQQIAAIK